MQLRDRMRLALAAAPVRPASTLPRPPAPRARPLPPGLPLTRVPAASGDALVCDERRPLSHRHGDLTLADALRLTPSALQRLAPGLQTSALERAAFLDVETTGLAGGTGTVAFLIGVATFEEGWLRLRQYFLADLGGEQPMLAAFSDVISECDVVVSYNGRSFDVPLLETRFILSRLRPPFGRLPHLDLLIAARRLFRGRLGSCRLADVEDGVLGFHRPADIPGWAVPGIYFEFLRSGATGALHAVLQHNRFDVLSLVTLLAYVGRLLDGRTAGSPADCLALARWDEAQGRLEDAAALYKRALEGAHGEEWDTALEGAIRLARRRGAWQDAEALLSRWLPGVSGAPARARLLVELAKIEEHRRRDFAAAEALTREAIALQEIVEHGAGGRGHPGRAALEHRLARLLRRRRACRRPS